MAGAAFALAVVLLAPPPRRLAEEPGATLRRDVRATQDLTVADVDRRQREQLRIEEQYERIWSYRGQALPEALEQLKAVTDILGQMRPTSAADVKAAADRIQEQAGLALTQDDLDAIYKSFQAGEVHPVGLAETLATIVERTLLGKIIVADKTRYLAERNGGRLRLEGLPETVLARDGVASPIEAPQELRAYLVEGELRRFFPSAPEQRLVTACARLLGQIIPPNVQFDRAATEQARARALAEVPAYTLTFKRGEVIARGEEPLTTTQAAALARMNERRQGAYPFGLGGVVVLTAFCLISVAVYARRFGKEWLITPSGICMVALPVLIALGIGRFLVSLPLSAGLVVALFPAALVGMLATIVMGAPMAFMLVLVSALLFGVAVQERLDEARLDFFILALFGGSTAVISLQSLRERKDVLQTGARVGLVNAAVVIVLALFRIPPLPQMADMGPVAAGLANGLLCAMLTMPLVVVFERSFGVVTDIRLLEITGPHHPLIRMLEEKAPGTYQHVLNVTKLAEEAAAEIGANFLLVRAGAYFHDIGKMIKPKYFSENQITLEDKQLHGRLSPYMSVLIVKNHVKEGIELGRRHGLPEKVIDFIPQHHGTSLIRYFYAEAQRRYEESESLDVVREKDFRYPGPKPQSIETAIVLLADSVEAIVTSTFTSPQVNENDLRRVVAQAVAERFQDGQFDECDLTMRDLYRIRESFVNTLKARFHHRIAYPALPRREPAREEPAAVTSAA